MLVWKVRIADEDGESVNPEWSKDTYLHCDSISEVLDYIGDELEAWNDEIGIGLRWFPQIELISMTQEEFDALPELEG